MGKELDLYSEERAELLKTADVEKGIIKSEAYYKNRARIE